jgi:hypothetical protein
MTNPRADSSSSKLGSLLNVLDRATKAVPAANFLWGVVGLSVVVAIISLLNGLNRLTLVAMVATFAAMVLFYVFSRIEKSTDLIVKLSGYVLLLITTLAFVFVIATSAWLAVTCKPRVMAYLYGVSEACYGAPVFAKPPIPKTDSQVHGWLKPANHPTPPNACTGDAFADRAAKVLIGDNALTIPARGKMLVLEIKKCEALSMEMSPEGILLNATINDGSGIAPAQVVNNEVTAQDGETYYARESADESILTVKNSKGLVLLEAEFLNKSAVRIRGQFGCVGGPIVPITDGQPIPGMRITNSCMAGFHSLLSID